MNLNEYCNNVLSSERYGELFKLACKRFLLDTQREDLVFREEEVERCVKFISLLKHFTGESNGKNFKLEDWQLFIVANIIGWYRRDSGKRRFNYSYIEVARKNGKTFLASALCLYFLCADRENAPEVLLAANSKEQAKIAFKMCCNLCQQLDKTNNILRRYNSKIDYRKKNGELIVLSADDRTLDGHNCSFGLIDEYHSAQTSKVRDVIKSSQGMRKNPHLCTITTAGFNRSLPCYQLRQDYIEVLRGIKQDDGAFIAIFSLDDGDDWTEEKNWVKANPNLDVTITKDFIRQQVIGAVNSVSEQVGVKTKNLNVWCDVSDVWLADGDLVKCYEEIGWERYKDKNVYIGVDLASTGDLTAVSYMFEDGGILYFKTEYYLPSSKLKNGRNNKFYQEHKDSIIVSEGNVTDYDRITESILTHNSEFNIVSISYDSWNATQWAIDCTAKGLPLNPYSQTIANFNRPTKEFERLVLSQKCRIDNNFLTKFCFANVVLKQDANGNQKPSKERNENKIDGVISMLQSLGGYLNKPTYNNSIFVI